MDIRTLSFSTKLRRLEAQIASASLADYAYADGQAALDILQSRTKSALSRINNLEKLSPSTSNSILRDTNFLLIRATYIIGIIIRSTSVRNGFELYSPFLDICHRLLGDRARLILSSEWQYVPFTHPQNLQELPNFVVIGLPASESDNVLIFPAAGHELGHSIWVKSRVLEALKQDISSKIDSTLIINRNKVEAAFQIPKSADFDQNMFVQSIKSDVYKSAIAQMEEYFSDFIGLVLFGEGYLHAFEFLIAPRLGGTRSFAYPDTQRRAKNLESFALTRLQIDLPAYHNAFLVDDPPQLLQDKVILDLADAVTEQSLDAIMDIVLRLISESGVSTPSSNRTALVERDFQQGVPFEGEASIGDLINAAWHIYRSMQQSVFKKQGREADEYLSDLVLKSAEIHEIRKHVL